MPLDILTEIDHLVEFYYESLKRAVQSTRRKSRSLKGKANKTYVEAAFIYRLV